MTENKPTVNDRNYCYMWGGEGWASDEKLFELHAVNRNSRKRQSVFYLSYDTNWSSIGRDVVNFLNIDSHHIKPIFKVYSFQYSTNLIN